MMSSKNPEAERHNSSISIKANNTTEVNRSVKMAEESPELYREEPETALSSPSSGSITGPAPVTITDPTPGVSSSVRSSTITTTTEEPSAVPATLSSSVRSSTNTTTAAQEPSPAVSSSVRSSTISATPAQDSSPVPPTVSSSVRSSTVSTRDASGPAAVSSSIRSSTGAGEMEPPAAPVNSSVRQETDAAVSRSVSSSMRASNVTSSVISSANKGIPDPYEAPVIAEETKIAEDEFDDNGIPANDMVPVAASTTQRELDVPAPPADDDDDVDESGFMNTAFATEPPVVSEDEMYEAEPKMVTPPAVIAKKKQQAAAAAEAEVEEEEIDMPDFSIYQTNIARRIWNAQQLAEKEGKNKSGALIRLLRQYQGHRKKVRDLIKAVEEYQAAMQTVTQCRTKVFDAYAELAKGTPIWDSVGKPLTPEQVKKITPIWEKAAAPPPPPPAERKKAADASKGKNKKAKAAAPSRTMEATTEAVTNTSNAMMKMLHLSPEQKKQIQRDISPEAMELQSKTIMAVAEEVARDGGSLVAMQQCATMYDSLNQLDFQTRIVDYIDEWDEVVNSQLDDEVVTARNLQKKRDHYTGKVDKLRSRINKIEHRGIRNAPPRLNRQLERNEDKLEEADDAYEDLANDCVVVLEESIMRGWVDLYPLLRNAIRFELNRLGRENASYRDFPHCMENLKTDYKNATKGTVDAPGYQPPGAQVPPSRRPSELAGEF